MKKVRLDRIAKGLGNYVKGVKTERTENRLATCKSCVFYKNGFCTDCGCITELKTKVMKEHCPQNQWEDTHIFKDTGIAVVNLSTDVVEMSQDKSSRGLVMTYKEPLTTNTGKIKVKILNERVKYLENPAKFDLEGINFSLACGNCTGSSIPPEKLEANKDFNFSFWIIPHKVSGKFSKTVKLFSSKKGKEFNIIFTIKGRK